MSKHILDRSRPEDGSRAERFAEIERLNGPEGSSRAARLLRQRPRDRKDSARAAYFARIERSAGGL
ncbi:hypothetical protein [Frigidibacter sp. ROC022]|uniref:hypothetical protein n=1 Tax=Frigidibacter sp. ROC022 TaxID=2971796 RepID=UPI00215B2B5D|nr:hypothetical protein [Frigidibacter sp. ROC022]MCR8724759.1 hypothetical protein [Frigidibacter sp. ROC022]